MIPSVFELQEVLFNKEKCNQYLLGKDVFYQKLICEGCGHEMTRNLERMTFRCTTKLCQKEFSIWKHTFFYGSKLASNNIIFLAHLWLNRVANSSAKGITGYLQHTITSFYCHFRELVSSTLDDEAQIIGGPGIIVEVDETKLGKRKYHRGH